MNRTQVQTVLAPIIGVVAAWLASKVPLLDQATWNTLISSVAVAGVAAFTAYITKKSNLADTLGKMSDTTVVTDKKTADSLPANSGVVSNTTAEVVTVQSKGTK